MTLKTPAFVLSSTDRRDWGLAGLAALLWISAYQNLHRFADLISFDLMRLERDSHWGASINYFFYDVPKILLLLFGMIFMITLLRTFITPEQTRRWLGGKREGIGNVLASMLGVVTPFCSCSAVPLFIGFVEAGIPLGVTLSFLIAAPMVNEVALVLLLGMFGWKIALLYMLSGMLLAVISGLIIGRLKMERYVEEFVYQVRIKQGVNQPSHQLNWHERFTQALESTREIVGKVWIYVVIGIAIGAGIHGFVPDDFLAEMMGRDSWWVVPIAVVLGIPMYSNAAGIVPVVGVLMDKGAALGTVLAFMMSVVALSLPEMIILRRVLKPPLIAVYVGILAVGIILTGYLFNLVI